MNEERFLLGYEAAYRLSGLDIPQDEYALKVNEAIKVLLGTMDYPQISDEEKLEALRKYLKSQEKKEEENKDSSKRILDTIEESDESESGLARKKIQAVSKEGQSNTVQDFGLLGETITSDLVRQHAKEAGISAASLSAILTLAPEIIKGIEYLIENGDIDLDEIDKTGEKVASASGEGFLAGYISSYLYITCAKGRFGETLMNIDAISLGAVVVLSLETIKSSVLVAIGKMTPKEMGDAFIDSAATSSLFVVGSHIGGALGEALGITLPGIGYLLGSLIGTSFCIAYNLTKKGFISLCIDTGFAAFGLVDQNYELSISALKEMGIEFSQYEEAEMEEANINEAELDIAEVNEANIETVKLTVLKRGLIGVRKIGYVD